MAAEAVLKAVQEHPEAWTRVDAILEHSKNQQTKFFGLQVRRRLRRRQQYPAGLATRCCCCSVQLWLIL
jgi:ferric-dicitrate binding protein FerR (iron transport regulator)